MFDIGFWELVTIAMVALLIIGPEKLPKFAHDAGHFVGKLRKYIYTAKNELQRELQLDQVNELNDNIEHLDKLMKEAPDRFMNDIESQTQNNKTTE